MSLRQAVQHAAVAVIQRDAKMDVFVFPIQNEEIRPTPEQQLATSHLNLIDIVNG